MNLKISKNKIIIIVVAAVVAIAVASSLLIAKGIRDKEPENSPSTSENVQDLSDTSNKETSALTLTATSASTKGIKETKSTEAEQKKIKIPYSGVAEGIYTVDGVDYVSNLKGIYRVTAKGKTTLTDQKTAHRFTIINDVIYYTVCDKTVNFEQWDDTFNWMKTSCWKMNLDGSGKEKLFSYYGCGFVIYVDNNNIYYADEGMMGWFTCAYGSYFYKYDLKTQKSKMISDGSIIYNGEKYANGLSDFVYANGNIFFHRTFGSSVYVDTDVDTYRYSIKEDTVYPLNFGSVAIFPKDNTSVDICRQYCVESSPIDTITFSLDTFDTKTNKITHSVMTNKISETEGDVLLTKIYSDDNSYFLDDDHYEGTDKSMIYFRDDSTGALKKIKKTDAKNVLTICEEKDIDERDVHKYEIARYKDGNRTVISTIKSEGYYSLRKVGANCTILYGFESEDDEYFANPTSHFYCKEIYFTKNG